MSVSGNRNAVMVVVRAMGCQCQGQTDRTEPAERDSETQPGRPAAGQTSAGARLGLPMGHCWDLDR